MIEHHDESFQRLVLSGGLNVEPDEFREVLKIVGLMFPEDAAQRLKTSVNNLVPLVDTRRLTPVKHGQRTYYRTSEIELLKASIDGERNRRRLGTITR